MNLLDAIMARLEKKGHLCDTIRRRTANNSCESFEIHSSDKKKTVGIRINLQGHESEVAVLFVSNIPKFKKVGASYISLNDPDLLDFIGIEVDEFFGEEGIWKGK